MPRAAQGRSGAAPPCGSDDARSANLSARDTFLRLEKFMHACTMVLRKGGTLEGGVHLVQYTHLNLLPDNSRRARHSPTTRRLRRATAMADPRDKGWLSGMKGFHERPHASILTRARLRKQHHRHENGKVAVALFGVLARSLRQPTDGVTRAAERRQASCEQDFCWRPCRLPLLCSKHQ